MSNSSIYTHVTKQRKTEHFRFYIYAYLRSKDSDTAKAGTPYYIGKGTGKRAWKDHRTQNGGIHLPKDKLKIVILEANLSEVGALALERRYIKWYGRKNIKTGLLLNQTDGGEGMAGFTGNRGKKRNLKQIQNIKNGQNNMSAAAKINKSNKLKAIKHSEETKNKIRYKRQFQKSTPESREKQRVARLGKSLPAATKSNISDGVTLQHKNMTEEKKNTRSSALSIACKGKHWYNDGTISKTFFPQNVPDGFTRGRCKIKKNSKYDQSTSG